MAGYRMARDGSDSAGRLGLQQEWELREKGGGSSGSHHRGLMEGFIGPPDSLSSHRSQHGLSDTSAHTLVSSTRAEGPRFTDSHTQRVRRGLCTLLIHLGLLSQISILQLLLIQLQLLLIQLQFGHGAWPTSHGSHTQSRFLCDTRVLLRPDLPPTNRHSGAGRTPGHDVGERRRRLAVDSGARC